MQLDASQIGNEFDQYLIIAGAPKSGTTSLFRYLSDHPQICPAKYKETYFFAREFDFKKVCKEEETLEAFQGYFVHCHSQHTLRVEATPYTLYSRDAIQKIISMLPSTTVLFILRDPVDRFISNYNFRLQRGHPSRRVTLEEFIRKQLNESGNLPTILQLGCYIEYLRPFFHAFAPEKIFIMFFEDLKATPVLEMQKLCVAMGVDANFYTNYRFDVHNQTVNVRYDWLNRMSIILEPLVARIRAQVMRGPRLHRLFENMIGVGKSAYRFLNNQDTEKKTFVSGEAKAFLMDYYRAYNLALSQELSRPIPWKSFEPERE